MIRRTVIMGVDELESVRGALVCRDLPITTAAGPASIRRGAVVDEALWATLSTQPGAQLDLVLPEPGELAQGDASWQFARAIGGAGIAIDPPHQGQCIAHAATNGVLRVRAAGVARVNRRETILLATALDGRVVEEGDTVAVVKASRLWTSADDLDRCRRVVGADPVLRVAPFVVHRAALLAGPRIRQANFSLASDNLRDLLARFGVELGLAERIGDDPSSIADAYRRCLDEGAEIVLIGGSIVLDPEDPYIVALDRVDGDIVSRGAPIDPGTMFWVAYARSAVFFGLASCELYGRRSVLDLLLPYAVAREPVTRGLLAELGYGGLLEQTFDARRPSHQP